MKEILEVSSNVGILELRGGPSETVLYLKDEPKLVSFHAEVGTTWRYFIGKEITHNLIKDNIEYERLVKYGKLKPKEFLSSQFQHIINLLGYGRYELLFCEFPYDLGVASAIQRKEKLPFKDDYGGAADLISTQTYRNSEHIEQYKTLIDKGYRPIVILIKLKNSWSIYILDGHHKLKAYKSLNINPTALLISRVDDSSLTETKTINAMQILGLTDESYLSIYKDEKKSKAYESYFYNYGQHGLNTYFKEKNAENISYPPAGS